LTRLNNIPSKVLKQLINNHTNFFPTKSTSCNNSFNEAQVCNGKKIKDRGKRKKKKERKIAQLIRELDPQ